MVLTITAAKDHEFHDRYWGMSDEDAAYAYRQELVNEDIRSFQVIYREPSGDDDGKIREFVSVQTGEGRAYRRTADVAADPLLSRIVLADAEREWKALYNRYKHLEEFIALVRDAVKPKRRRVG
jgi:hypothetical protein